MILAWLGNNKLPNWHRNVDCDELWIHYSGPTVTVETGRSGNAVELSEGQMLLVPRGVLHTSDAPSDPPAVIAIAERRIREYERRDVDVIDESVSATHEVAAVSWRDETRRYTPPWRYPQVELISADAFVVQVMTRAEGSLQPRGTHGFDEVWLVMKGKVQMEGAVEGEGPVVDEGWMARIPAGLLYRPVALSPWTAALVLHRKDSL